MIKEGLRGCWLSPQNPPENHNRYLLVNWLALPQSYGLEVGIFHHCVEAGTSFEGISGIFGTVPRSAIIF